ncbi:hypothetical protein OSTOST_16473, partial [Ostertagia ostertagi]
MNKGWILSHFNPQRINRSIFRLLQQKGHLEEDQIEKLTMMSGKETRELLYAMLEEGYIQTKMLRNIILRRAYETKENRLLIERQVKMESIIETINADEALDEETKKQQ